MTTRTISVEDAGKVLGISRGVAYEAARTGTLPCLRLGRRLVVPIARLADLLGESVDEVVSALDHHRASDGEDMPTAAPASEVA
jgi:excisionase family DNA binding protein